MSSTLRSCAMQCRQTFEYAYSAHRLAVPELYATCLPAVRSSEVAASPPKSRSALEPELKVKAKARRGEARRDCEVR
jgi:hypothetical protein